MAKTKDFFNKKKPENTALADTLEMDDTVDAHPMKPSKPASEAVVCVVDYGSFICLADKLSETFAETYYYTPTSQEFYSITDLVKADGLKKVERVFDIFDPEFLDRVDLFVFPDIGYGGLQKYLRSIGKAVWGSVGMDELELMRTQFIKTLEELDLPVIHTEKVKGLSKLREHLATVKNKYIKVNRYRGNMETWHHIDIEHSLAELDRLAVEFGGLQDAVTFVVQDDIETDVEIGYDGWSVDGQFPEASFQGYEKKDELYLGSLRTWDQLPKEVKLINEALAPLMKKFQYRNFFATEIRIKDGTPYFIDPTMRMPGLTGEQMLETCTNLADVIWHGAHGDLIKPEYGYTFAAEATMHYSCGGEWKAVKIPEKISQWVKLLHYCKLDGMFHFPPSEKDEIGVMLGCGDSIEEAISSLKKHLKSLGDEPIKCKLDGFFDLMQGIKDAANHGIIFTEEALPDITKIIHE